MLEESHLFSLVSILAMKQGLKDNVCFKADSREAGDKGTSIECIAENVAMKAMSKTIQEFENREEYFGTEK